MNGISLKMKLGIGFGGLIAIILVLGYFSYSSTAKLDKLEDDAADDVKMTDLAVQLDLSTWKQIAALRGFMVSGDEQSMSEYLAGQKEFADTLDHLGKMQLEPDEQKMVTAIHELNDQLAERQRKLIASRRNGNANQAQQLLAGADSIENQRMLKDRIEEFVAYQNKQKEDHTSAEKAVAARVKATTLGAVCIGTLLGLAVAILISRSISNAVARMLAMIQEIANKNLTISDMDITSADEIGQAGIALNQMKNSLHEIIQSISETAQHVASASEELSATSQQISANSEETSAQAGTVSQATQQVSQNLQSVSTGAEEMTSTIQSIASNAHEAATVASNAVQTAQAANTTVGKLGESSAEIGEVIKVITSIAQQTNLLALNATIEAARAGEAGKGFAVVANEVKELAKQTAKATEDISRKIAAIQADTKGAVDAIGSISEVINKVNDISSTIATAVEQQSATTNEMTRNVADAAKGSGEITHNIEGVAEAARGTSSSAQESQKAANELAEMSVQLRSLVELFKITGTAAGSSPATAPRAAKSMAASAAK